MELYEAIKINFKIEIEQAWLEANIETEERKRRYLLEKYWCAVCRDPEDFTNNNLKVFLEMENYCFDKGNGMNDPFDGDEYAPNAEEHGFGFKTTVNLWRYLYAKECLGME
jgi:hypothetical protein